MDELVAAVRELRSHLGDSQQAFATRLNLSISAIANYERDRGPTGKALLELENLANANGLVKLAKTFEAARLKELGRYMIEIPPDKKEDFDALMTILLLGGKRNRDALAEWNRISEPIKAANRAKHARASAFFALHTEVQRRIRAGESDDQIVQGLHAWQPELVKTLAANLREMDRLSETSQKGKK